MVIKIRRKTQPEWLIWWIMILPFLFGLLFDFFHFPDVIKYTMDVCWMCLFVMMSITTRHTRRSKDQLLKVWILLFLIYTASVYMVQYQSVFYYIWGLRNNFRYYVVFFAIVSFVSEKTAREWMKMLDALFWTNFAVSMIQYFVFHIYGDHLGGLFGYLNRGVNAYTIILNSIIVAKSILCYISKEESLSLCFTKCAAAIIIAILAELKFFFVQIIIIVILASLITRFSWRKLAIIIGVTIGIGVGTTMLAMIYARNNLSWFTLEKMLAVINSDKGYTSSGDLNRLNAIVQINAKPIFDNILERFFGLGLGNCDVSSLSIFNTPFYQKYSYLHHTWFSMPMVYLETGYIGLVIYFGFFGICFFMAKRQSRMQNSDVMFCHLGMIMSVMCFMLAIYNSSLRTEAGFMVYFVLALPFIKSDTAKGALSK